MAPTATESSTNLRQTTSQASENVRKFVAFEFTDGNDL